MEDTRRCRETERPTLFEGPRLEARAIGSDRTSATYAWASFVVAYQPKSLGYRPVRCDHRLNALLDAAQLFSNYIVVSIFGYSIIG